MVAAPTNQERTRVHDLHAAANGAVQNARESRDRVRVRVGVGISVRVRVEVSVRVCC